MTAYLKPIAVASCLLILAGCVETPAPDMPSVGSGSDLSQFQGARAGQAEMGIQSLGFQIAQQQGLTTYWFNPSTGACAEIVTSDGRYSSVRMVSALNC